jgi:hypothetical protein
MLTASTALTHAGVWLIAQLPTVGDTLVMKQAPIDPGWFERTQGILDALLTASFIALAAAVIPAAWNFRKSYKKTSELLDRVYADINPIAHHASRIAENVDYVSTAIRADVQRASALVTDAERRLQKAVARAETRARELEALIEIAQEEAEDTFVTAAATVRGVRASMASLGSDLGEAIVPPRPPRRPAVADAPLLATGDALDELALVEARPLEQDLLDAGLDDGLDDLPYDEDDFEEDLTDAEDDSRVAAREQPRVRPRRGPRTRG